MKGIRLLGLGLLFTGLLLNIWCIEQLLASDGEIESGEFVAAITILQLLWIALGVRFLLVKRGLPLSSGLYRSAILGLSILLLVGLYGNGLALLDLLSERRMHRSKIRFEELVSSEELLLELSPELAGLTQSALNLQIPDHRSHLLFADRVTVLDLGSDDSSPSSKRLSPVSMKLRRWSMAERSHSVPVQQMKIWEPVLENFRYFEHAEFYFIEGHLVKESPGEWEADLGFRGLARTSSGQWQAIKALVKTRWKQADKPLKDQSLESSDENQASAWQILDWRTHSLQTMVVNRPLFSEVSGAVLDQADLARARRSIHASLALQFLLNKDLDIQVGDIGKDVNSVKDRRHGPPAVEDHGTCV